MSVHPDRETLFQETIARLGDLDANEGADVLLHYFLSVLNGTEVETARRMRDELMSHFGGRYCSPQICSKMIEMLNGHFGLAQRNRDGQG